MFVNIAHKVVYRRVKQHKIDHINGKGFLIGSTNISKIEIICVYLSIRQNIIISGMILG